VGSHIKLGSAYLDYKCLDQAYEHLKVGYEKNKEFKSNLAYERNRDKAMNHAVEENQMWVLQLLSQTCLQTNKLREALSYIEEACELCENTQNTEKFGPKSSHYAILCEFKGDYYYLNDKLDQAMLCFEDAFIIYSELNQRHEGAANALRQMAKIYEVQGKYDVALESLGECILYVEQGENENKNTLLIELLFKKIELLGLQKDKDSQTADQNVINCYVRVKDLTREIHGSKNKRTLKSLRNLAIAQSKKKMYEQALGTIEEIEEIEFEYYGEKSKHMAKTFTLKATLLYRCGNKSRAKDYMRKAVGIYEDLGDKVAVKGVREKLKLFEER